MMKSKDNDQPFCIELPQELWGKVAASFSKLEDLQELATVSKVFSEETSKKRAEFKKNADKLIKTNDKHMQHFLHEAHKKNRQWLLDYCYQEAVKCYFLDKRGQINHSKKDNQNQCILDWAIKCFQPIKIIKALCKETRTYDSYFRHCKLTLALEVGNISVIKLLPQSYAEILEVIEYLTINKNSAAIFKEVFPYFAPKIEEGGGVPINILKLALLKRSVEKAKLILKGDPSLAEMIKTRGEALFSDMYTSKEASIGAKLLNYSKEKVEKIDKMKIKEDSGKMRFFNPLLTQTQRRKHKEENNKLQLVEKLIKRVIENDDSIELTKKDLAQIKKSKKLTDLYNASIELSDFEDPKGPK
jgi:hypothetical protein